MDVFNGNCACPHNGRLPEVLLVKFGEHSCALSPDEVRLFLDPLSELLSVGVDGLAGARADILGDFAPVLSVLVDSLDEALVLLFTPVAFSLARHVLY